MYKNFFCPFVFFIFISCFSFSSQKYFFSDYYDPFVSVTYNENITSVIILIQELNLKYQIYTPLEPYTDNAFGVILIGEKFPIEKFKEILRFIKNYYPELRYIQLIQERKNIPKKNLYGLFIAVSTEIAIKNNLKALNDNDYKTLLSLNTKDEIHKFILKFQSDVNSISRPMGQ